MASKIGRDQARALGKRALAVVFFIMALTPVSVGPVAAFDVAQGPNYDDSPYRAPSAEAPETEQPWQWEGSPSEDGTADAPDAAAPEPPSGCNLRDDGPLELLV